MEELPRDQGIETWLEIRITKGTQMLLGVRGISGSIATVTITQAFYESDLSIVHFKYVCFVYINEACQNEKLYIDFMWLQSGSVGKSSTFRGLRLSSQNLPGGSQLPATLASRRSAAPFWLPQQPAQCMHIRSHRHTHPYTQIKTTKNMILKETKSNGYIHCLFFFCKICSRTSAIALFSKNHFK